MTTRHELSWLASRVACFLTKTRHLISWDFWGLGIQLFVDTCTLYRCLVGGLVAIFYFPIYWVANHPNWLSYFSEGFKPPTSQVFRLQVFFGFGHGVLSDHLLSTRSDDDFNRAAILAYLRGESQRISLRLKARSRQWWPANPFGYLVIPKIGVPLNHPFLVGFSTINIIIFGYHPIWISHVFAFPALAAFVLMIPHYQSTLSQDKTVCRSRFVNGFRLSLLSSSSITSRNHHKSSKWSFS